MWWVPPSVSKDSTGQAGRHPGSPYCTGIVIISVTVLAQVKTDRFTPRPGSKSWLTTRPTQRPFVQPPPGAPVAVLRAETVQVIPMRSRPLGTSASALPYAPNRAWLQGQGAGERGAKPRVRSGCPDPEACFLLGPLPRQQQEGGNKTGK